MSDYDCTLERRSDHEPALRLGLRLVNGLSRVAAARIVTARHQQPFVNTHDLAQRAALNRRDLAALAAANALVDIAGHRRAARWQVAGVEATLPLVPAQAVRESVIEFARQSEGEELVEDYASVGLTLGRHPLALLRDRLQDYRCSRELQTLRHGSAVQIAGLVICRQRPGSASGVIFVTLEDETGVANIIVWRSLAERQRRELLQAQLLAVSGELQREGEVIHVIAHRLHDHSHLLGRLVTASRDFH
ncbi:MAG: error-prone DNA polymerase [Gammaproteobacteria bacterium]|nr:MAG: error-prone DNA polymerase [Gammaproteobacteria bacterium]TND02708.1 MAG: error-prone DNA polymerase [Gammaproteobacteria bacterium]